MPVFHLHLFRLYAQDFLPFQGIIHKAMCLISFNIHRQHRCSCHVQKSSLYNPCYNSKIFPPNYTSLLYEDLLLHIKQHIYICRIWNNSLRTLFFNLIITYGYHPLKPRYYHDNICPEQSKSAVASATFISSFKALSQADEGLISLQPISFLILNSSASVVYPIPVFSLLYCRLYCRYTLRWRIRNNMNKQYLQCSCFYMQCLTIGSTFISYLDSALRHCILRDR